MDNYQPIIRDQRKVDADHVRLLAIFHYVGAGLALLAIFGLFAHYMFFHAIMNNPDFWQHQKGPPPPKEIMAIFKYMYVVLGVWFGSSLVLNLLSAIFLGLRKFRTFSLIVAAINCIHIPLGTVLGIFTLVVLLRDSVRQLYEGQ